MLSKIYIKNYILIDELELDFSDGLNIITGETGAGKSILINAIDTAFGAKAGKEVIKSNASKAIIEITINNKKHNLEELFEEYGIEYFDSEIVLSKEITQTGSRSRVNGSLVNQDFIKILRELFLDIHSQHQAYSFLQSKYHINLLDAYIKNPKLEQYNKEYEKYLGLIKELEALKSSAQKTEDQIDFLKFQVDEIEKAELKSTSEDVDLNKELEVLENSEKLKELTGSAYWSISGDDNSILDALIQIKSTISKASALDESISNNELEVISIIESLKELGSNLRNYSSSLENDTERINEIQERLFLIEKLKRKYGGSIEKVLETYEKLLLELNNIEFSTQNIETLEIKINSTRELLLKQAQEISSERKKYAKDLSLQIVKKLEKLELPKVRFDIGFTSCDLCIKGVDKVEFLISTNISEELKSLAKVASGGEISRVMLAIKTIFAQSDNIDTVIFDEIDTGISGKTSQSVADEVKELSKYMQIIMITHQAIIASKSDKHIYISKTQDDKTKVNISILDDELKLRAIAELAGGEITEKSLELAKMLVN